MGIDPIVLTLSLGMLALVPLVFVTTTSFLKLSIVLSLVRNALGVHQSPPNIVRRAVVDRAQWGAEGGLTRGGDRGS